VPNFLFPVPSSSFNGTHEIGLRCTKATEAISTRMAFSNIPVCESKGEVGLLEPDKPFTARFQQSDHPRADQPSLARRKLRGISSPQDLSDAPIAQDPYSGSRTEHRTGMLPGHRVRVAKQQKRRLGLSSLWKRAAKDAEDSFVQDCPRDISAPVAAQRLSQMATFEYRAVGVGLTPGFPHGKVSVNQVKLGTPPEALGSNPYVAPPMVSLSHEDIPSKSATLTSDTRRWGVVFDPAVFRTEMNALSEEILRAGGSGAVASTCSDAALPRIVTTASAPSRKQGLARAHDEVSEAEACPVEDSEPDERLSDCKDEVTATRNKLTELMQAIDDLAALKSDCNSYLSQRGGTRKSRGSIFEGEIQEELLRLAAFHHKAMVQVRTHFQLMQDQARHLESENTLLRRRLFGHY